MEYLSSIVFHTVVLKNFENEIKKINCSYVSYRGHGWNGVSIIDSIPHCHTEKSLKMRENKEIWLRLYKGQSCYGVYHR